MPIEIKELVIKAVVQNVSSSAGSGTSGSGSAGQMDAIVAECVEQVLNILKEKQER